MATYDEAFGLHFRGEHADPASTRIKKLDERVKALESEVHELKDMLRKISERICEHTKETQKTCTLFDNIGGFFTNLFYKNPVKNSIPVSENLPVSEKYIDKIYEDSAVAILKLPNPDTQRDFKKISSEEMNAAIDELNAEENEKYAITTGKIPTDVFESRLKKLQDLRESEDHEFASQLTDTERFQSFAQFTRERNAEVNKVFLETEERRGF
jgi:hypothetical protein